MFDFRYHVASLAAVFLALVIGMLVGAGISGRGLLDETERNRLEARIADLEGDVNAERLRADGFEAASQAMDDALEALVANRLSDRKVAVVFAGSVDAGVRKAVEETVALGGGRVVRLSALRMPVPTAAVEAELERHTALHGYLGSERMEDLGRDVARELADGDQMPLLTALGEVLVEERGPTSADVADAVVVCRTALPQQAETARFLRGLYSGLAGVGRPAVGVETTTAPLSAIEVYRRNGLSTVDDVDLAMGRVALAVLLADGPAGHYGIKDTASEAVPEIDPVPPPAPE